MIQHELSNETVMIVRKSRTFYTHLMPDAIVASSVRIKSSSFSIFHCVLKTHPFIFGCFYSSRFTMYYVQTLTYEEQQRIKKIIRNEKKNEQRNTYLYVLQILVSHFNSLTFKLALIFITRSIRYFLFDKSSPLDVFCAMHKELHGINESCNLLTDKNRIDANEEQSMDDRWWWKGCNIISIAVVIVDVVVVILNIAMAFLHMEVQTAIEMQFVYSSIQLLCDAKTCHTQ